MPYEISKLAGAARCRAGTGAPRAADPRAAPGTARSRRCLAAADSNKCGRLPAGQGVCRERGGIRRFPFILFCLNYLFILLLFIFLLSPFSFYFSVEKVFASLPQVERGVSKIIGGDPKGNNFLYTNGKCVVIRNIDVMYLDLFCFLV